MSRATDALDRLYSRLPRLDCQGMCQQSCGPINMGQAERARLTRRLGYVPRWPGVVAALTMAVLGADKALTCPLLDKGTGRCTVYAIRPMLCRLWGLVRTMACPWGCVPARWLTDNEAGALLDAAKRVVPDGAGQ